MIILILLGLTALLAYVITDTKASRLETEVLELRNTVAFLRSDAEHFDNELQVAYNKIDQLEDKYVFTDQDITEFDQSLHVIDDVRCQGTCSTCGGDEPCEEDALAQGYTYDDNGNLVAPQSLDDFVSDVSQAIDSIKWTSQDGE
jgi:hypothetical protein